MVRDHLVKSDSGVVRSKLQRKMDYQWTRSGGE